MRTPARRFGSFRNASKTTVYPAGTTIFEEGHEGHTMYAIKRGQGRGHGRRQDGRPLGDEEIFGEMALLEHAARTASVVTHFALQLMQLLSERLRRADDLYRTSQAPGP
jgi:CRP-like cAMP-binding protein